MRRLSIKDWTLNYSVCVITFTAALTSQCQWCSLVTYSISGCLHVLLRLPTAQLRRLAPRQRVWGGAAPACGEGSLWCAHPSDHPEVRGWDRTQGTQGAFITACTRRVALQQHTNTGVNLVFCCRWLDCIDCVAPRPSRRSSGIGSRGTALPSASARTSTPTSTSLLVRAQRTSLLHDFCPVFYWSIV